MKPELMHRFAADGWIDHRDVLPGEIFLVLGLFTLTNLICCTRVLWRGGVYFIIVNDTDGAHEVLCTDES